MVTPQPGTGTALRTAASPRSQSRSDGCSLSLRVSASQLFVVGIIVGLSLACAASSAPPPAVSATGPSLPVVIAKSDAPAAAPVAVPQKQEPAEEIDVVPSDPRPPLEFTEVSEKAWVANLKTKLASRHRVPPESIFLSPARQRAAFLDSTPRLQDVPAKPANKPSRARKRVVARKPPPRRHRVVVVDLEGRVLLRFRPILAKGSDEPPKDLRFLAEDRLVYEVPAPPALPPAAPSRKAKRRGKGPTKAAPVDSGPPPRLFVIQPVGKRPRPIRCEGTRFAFNPGRSHLAHVARRGDGEWIAVDGQRVYPRKRGETRVASDLGWSRDGVSLAFIESGPPPRLTLLAEFDNANGDHSWDLPTSASGGAEVFFTGRGKLVVGRSASRPIFTAPLSRQPTSTFDP